MYTYIVLSFPIRIDYILYRYNINNLKHMNL